MQKTTLLLCFLLALAACNQDTSDAKKDKEAQMEESTNELDQPVKAETSASAPPSAPEPIVLPDEPLPGATSTASSAPSAANPLFNLTLQPGQAGAVRIGMPIAELRQKYGANKIRETTLSQEGTEAKAFEVLGDRRRTDLVVAQQCTGTTCQVSRITVMNPAFKTQAGVGIGSTLGDVKKSFTISGVGTGEGKFVAISQNAKMSFVLDMKNIPAERWGKLKLQDVPDNTPVSGIFLY